MSATDSLTGGYNRRHVEQVLVAELSRSARFARPLSLIMFDLDNFKQVNDSRGHAAGDEVLREIHRTALAELREVDSLGRFGGDEFLIVLPETDTVAARLIAQRLRKVAVIRLREKFGPASPESQVTLSMGVLTLPGHFTLPVNTAIIKVDDLLYDAKRGGKNRISFG